MIAIDLDSARLKRADEFGATDTVNSGEADWKEQVLALTDGPGVDVAIEAVGIPSTFTMATEIVRPGGSVANIGVHGKPVELKSQRTVDQEHRHLDGTREHQHAGHAAQARRRAQAAGRQVRHPRIHASIR